MYTVKNHFEAICIILSNTCTPTLTLQRSALSQWHFMFPLYERYRYQLTSLSAATCGLFALAPLVEPRGPGRVTTLRNTATRIFKEANVGISAALREICINVSQGIRTCNRSGVTARSLEMRESSSLWLCAAYVRVRVK